jgi:hypothetical protein
VTAQPSFSTNDAVKHTSSGGVESWDTEKYFNVWITILSDNLLGYSSFPGDGSPDEQGVVIDYRALPGGSYMSYSKGKTLVHETGHFFNLYHIWGDDGGSCTGTDYVDDTPNQANSSNTCYSGIHTDNCTRSGNGIMYQNYMDYTPDDCMVMFTAAQVSRMQAALTAYYASFLTSDGCQPPVLKNYNAAIISIDQPGQRLCSSSFTPVISIKNKGMLTLTSLNISVFIDEALVLDYNWNGSLTYNNTTTITLSSIIISEGTHRLTISCYKPNGNDDEEAENDSLSVNIQYYKPVTEIIESFEGSIFSPAGWDVVNPDHSITWQKTGSAGKTGIASAVINNHDYTDVGQKDDLRLPLVNISSSVDSAFLSFRVAAAAYTATTISNNTWDTLEVIVSTNCGATFTSVYKKWGANLVTRSGATTESFIPSANEWRKDSINLENYIGQNSLLIGFRNTTGYENNIYLDDINLRTVTVNSNLKNAGFLVAPVPTSGWITVQFYPQPANLQRIEVFNTSGQQITTINTGGAANNSYRFDLSSQAAGVYIVRAVFSDKVLVKKIFKN